MYKRQVFLDQHPEMFETGAERADLKLFLLCAILGVTGWALSLIHISEPTRPY